MHTPHTHPSHIHIPHTYTPLTHTHTHTHNSRWIRLLFGREFPLPNVLELWDALFADGPSLSLMDYVCVAMLMHIREVRE